MKKLIELLEKNRNIEAEKEYELIKEKLNNRDKLFFKALISQKLEKYFESEKLYKLILKKDPEDGGAIINLTGLLNSVGKNSEALLILKNFKEKKSEKFLLAMFDCNFGLNKLNDALEILEKFNDQNNIFVIERKSALLIKMNNPEEAILLLEDLANNNKYNSRPLIYGNLAAAYNKVAAYESALSNINKALAINELSWQFWLTKANSLSGLEKHIEAKDILSKIYLQFNKPVEVIGTLARVESLNGNISDSMRLCYEGLEKNPNEPSIICCLADNLASIGKIEEAYHNYEKSLKINPNDDLTQWHYSLTELRYENFKTGWDRYKWGFKRKKAGRGLYKYNPESEWRGLTEEKKLVVWGEQGIGDELMFSKFLKYIPNEIKNIEVRIDNRLVDIFNQRLNTRKGVIFTSEKNDNIGCHIPIGNLPSLFWKNFNADPHAKASFLSRENIYQKNNKIRIGILWRGGISLRMQTKRSIPLGVLSRVKNLFNENINIVLLQYNFMDNEKLFLTQLFENRLNIPSYDPKLNVDAWINHIDSCDAIISVDNSAVHFAGALGIPTLAMIPKYADFRWGCSKKTNIWYESVTLLRGSDHMSLDELSLEINTWLKNIIDFNHE